MDADILEHYYQRWQVVEFKRDGKLEYIRIRYMPNGYSTQIHINEQDLAGVLHILNSIRGQ